jgi:hypothetical protein
VVEPRKTRIFTTSPATRKDWLASLPLQEFLVDNGPLDEARRELASALKGTERDVQRVIEAHPRLLASRLGAGWGWVVPQKRLGSEFVTDFLIAEQLSPGYYWQAVELESPRAAMFTKAGDPARYLVHAIRQIQDWRAWLTTNQSYAARSRGENGLGLLQISPNLPGLILIGRRGAVAYSTHARRRQMRDDLRIEIRSYDSLLDPPEPGPLYARFNDPSWW